MSRRHLLRAAALMLVAGTLSGAFAQQAPAHRYAGSTLAEALRHLQTRGLRIVFSTEIVRPDMRVAAEPKSASPRKILDEILKAHQLRVRGGPRDSLLVVRMTRTAAPHGTSVTTAGTITGVVVDARTGTPLSGASITVTATRQTAVSGQDGGFRIDAVPAEPQILFVSLVGFALSRPVVDVPPNGTAVVTLPLADGTGTYTEEITVVGDRFRGDPVVPAEQLLTSADLQDLRGVIADDALRAVQALPAVATGDDFRSEFSVRGSDFRHMRMSLDGVFTSWLVHLVRGPDDTGSVSMINADVLERATLAAGAYAQVGPERTGAWLNLDVREGSRAATRGQIAVSASSASTVLDGPLGKGRGSWLVSVRQSYLQWLIKQLESNGSTSFGFTDAQSKLVFDVNPRHQVRFTVAAGRSQLEQSNPGGAPNSIGKGAGAMGLASLTWRWTLPSAVVTERVSGIGIRFKNGGRYGQELARGWSTDVSSDTQIAWMPRSSLVATTGSYVQRRRTGQAIREFWFTVPNVKTTLKREDLIEGSAISLAGFGQLRWTSERASVDTGVRVNHDRFAAKSSASPWLLVSAPVAARLSLRGGASVSHQFPELEHVSGVSALVDSRAERATSIDAGLEYRASDTLRLQASVFERRERDVLRREDSEFRLSDGAVIEPGPGVWVNALDGSARGVELLLQRRAASGLVGWIGYTFGRARYTDTITRERFWADFDQRHALSVYGKYRVSAKTSVSAKLRVGSNFPLPGYFSREGGRLFVGETRNDVRLPVYSRVDLRANRTFNYHTRRLTLFAEVLNVFGHRNYGPTDGGVMRTGEASGYVERLFPFLPSAGILIEF